MSDKPTTSYLTEFEEEEVFYEYAHIRFRHQGPRKEVEEIDIVPTDWLFLTNNDSIHCKFLSSKYLQIRGKVKLLHDLVKQRGPVPNDWPSFPVKAVGRAHTYEAALTKLEILKTTDNVFTDSENSNDETEKALIKQVKRRMLLAQQEELKRKMMERNDDDICPTAKRMKNHSEASRGNNKTSKTADNINNNICTDMLPTSGNHLHRQSQDSFTSDSEVHASLTEDSGFNDCERSTNGKNAPKSSEGSLSKTIDISNHPIVDLSTVECKTAVVCSLNIIMAKLGNLEIGQKDLYKKLKELMKARKNDLSEFSEKYHLDLPLNTVDKFKDFDASLTSNDSMRKDLYNEFRSCSDKNLSITKTFSNIMRKFIHKEVILTYTAIRPPKPSSKSVEETGDNQSDDNRDDKNLFEPLQFCKCMFGK
ncbi:hypothetical protein QAD02_000805 [Eretmocerus hayati]|uniref:Uncharacterized protein n=1 Tax=Eretmocerus hayati TaxID=131215 RepID=A0ACC2NEL9_9HYME|nr:hypothetical protein QAD02_000805 [Eretmocerus hayati]